MSGHGGQTGFNQLPLIGRRVRDFDRQVGEKGLQGAMKGLIEETGSKLEVSNLKGETERVLREEQVLLIGNHPYDAEMVPLLASLPNRDDVYGIGTADFMTIGPNFSQHLLPVYIGHQTEKSRKLSVKLGKRIRFRPSLSSMERKAKNRKTIDLAKQKIEAGGLVILFPEGLLGKGGKWFSGVGYLVNKLGSGSHAYLVKAFIEGSSNFDLLRLVPGIRKILPTLRVTYSESKKVSDILNQSTEPKEICKILEGEYKNWANKL